METSLLKKLQSKGSSGKEEKNSVMEGTSAPMTPLDQKSVDLSSKLFRRLKKDGVTKKHLGGVDLHEGAGKISPLDFDDTSPLPGPPRFHAGKRVDPEHPGSFGQTSRSSRPLLIEGSHGTRVSPGWKTILRMMEDIGWDIVLERVRSFVRGLSLTEVAQRFQAPPEDLVEVILQSWRDAGIHKEELISSRLQSVPETAAALIVYVNEFGKEG